MLPVQGTYDVRLAVVCPMANQEKSAVSFVEQVLAQCAPVREVEMFVVLDNATHDNSVKVLRALEAREPRLHVVWAPENRCVVDAYMRGYREGLASGADWILEIDSGFSHDPADIPQFFEWMAKGCHCVFGSRFMTGGAVVRTSLSRRIVSRGGTLLTNFLLGTTMQDMTSGFEMFRRETLQMVLDKGVHSRAHFFQTEIKVHCRNLRFVEVPIRYSMASPSVSPGVLRDAFRELGRLVVRRISGDLQPATEPEQAIRAGRT